MPDDPGGAPDGSLRASAERLVVHGRPVKAAGDSDPDARAEPDGHANGQSDPDDHAQADPDGNTNQHADADPHADPHLDAHADTYSHPSLDGRGDAPADLSRQQYRH